MPRPRPSIAYEDVRANVRRKGRYIPASAADVRKVVDAMLAGGEPASDEVARLDLLVAIDRHDVKPYRYYVARWRWGEKRVRNMLKDFLTRGANGAQTGRNEGAKDGDTETESASEGATGAQQGRNRGAVLPEDRIQNTEGEKDVSQTRRRKPPTLTFSPESLRLAEVLRDAIRERDPKARPPNLESWAAEIDKLNRIDKREWEEVERVLRWSQADGFWQANILSGRKFREKYGQLVQQSKRDLNGTATKSHSHANRGGERWTVDGLAESVRRQQQYEHVSILDELARGTAIDPDRIRERREAANDRLQNGLHGPDKT